MPTRRHDSKRAVQETSYSPLAGTRCRHVRQTPHLLHSQLVGAPLGRYATSTRAKKGCVAPPVRAAGTLSASVRAKASYGLTAVQIRVSPVPIMKQLHGTATEVVAAPLDECLALLEAVDRYPDWYPEVVREVEVLDRDPSGQPTRARTKLHVSRPLVKDFDLVLAIVVEPPATVKLTRPTNDSSQQQLDVTWRLQDRDGTRIELYLNANLRVPRLLPLGGIGTSMAKGFVAAASRALAPEVRSS